MVAASMPGVATSGCDGDASRCGVTGAASCALDGNPPVAVGPESACGDRPPGNPAVPALPDFPPDVTVTSGASPPAPAELAGDRPVPSTELEHAARPRVASKDDAYLLLVIRRLSRRTRIGAATGVEGNGECDGPLVGVRIGIRCLDAHNSGESG